MEAQIKMFWITLECPECLTPQNVNRYVDMQGKVWNIGKTFVQKCTFCDKMFEVAVEIGKPLEKGSDDE